MGGQVDLNWNIESTRNALTSLQESADDISDPGDSGLICSAGSTVPPAPLGPWKLPWVLLDLEGSSRDFSPTLLSLLMAASESFFSELFCPPSPLLSLEVDTPPPPHSPPEELDSSRPPPFPSLKKRHKLLYQTQDFYEPTNPYIDILPSSSVTKYKPTNK